MGRVVTSRPKFASFISHTRIWVRERTTGQMKGCRWRMGLSQNCWREGETLARETFELMIVSARSAPVVSNASLWRTASGWPEIQPEDEASLLIRCRYSQGRSATPSMIAGSRGLGQAGNG